ncbi:MAG: amidophosphoribosyltransferase [Spirochaetia bacterium]|nr:amidophosphoribosyltransferase [Spirochaetia bacterium]
MNADERFSDRKLHEECAVFGASLKKDTAAGITYNGLLSLQHRGQEGAGIAVCSENKIICHKGLGLVSEVFGNREIRSLPPGRTAIGHNRYSTTGNNTAANVQPFVTDYLTGRIAVAHNGNIINARFLRKELFQRGVDFNASSDSEIISSLIAYETVRSFLSGRDSVNKTLEGVIEACKKLEGAFSLVILNGKHQLIAVRDPHGFRPLCIGQNETGTVVASESCAVECCGFSFLRDIRPGEVLVIENGEITFAQQVLPEKKKGLCVFEYIYFARPDSMIDGLNVAQARRAMGRILAEEAPVDADAVSPIPDSGWEAALGYAETSGLPFLSSFVKNRYIGRSFIYPIQEQRESAVRLKLNPLRGNVEGKRIVLIDDSIVRGTTCALIIRSLKEAGAKEVHMRISSPPFRYTCYFGTDIGDEKNLLANKIDPEKMARAVGADSLKFLSLSGLRQACRQTRLPLCLGCFTGDYGIPVEKICKEDFE